MTIESQQFMQMLTAHRSQQEQRILAAMASGAVELVLECRACGHDLPHTVTREGGWEVFTCTCGHSERYRVG